MQDVCGDDNFVVDNYDDHSDVLNGNNNDNFIVVDNEYILVTVMMVVRMILLLVMTFKTCEANLLF